MICSIDMNKKRPIAIDLFAGCGGLSLGFEQAGFDIAASVEIDPVHSAVHEYNFPYGKTICSDVTKLSGNDIIRLANLKNKEIDVVIGGAPCQGFSLIGKRTFDDPRNYLVKHYVRLVGELNPKYCVFENVRGLTVGKHVQFLHDLISELSQIGYKVHLPYRVLNARDYGVPQDRKRLFLLAARLDMNEPEYPKENPEKVTVKDAISDLPNADDYENLNSDDSIALHWNTETLYAKKLRCLVCDEENFGYDREFDKNLLTSSARTNHTELSKTRFLQTEQGDTEPHSRFLKLKWDGVCNTLRAGTDSARGAFTSPRPIHPVYPRVITVREAARLHSYPDWFRFNKTKWHGFREIGNSVPPLLARAVGDSIIKALGIKPIKPKQVLRLGDSKLLEFNMAQAADYFDVPRSVIPQRNRKIKSE